MMKGVIGWKYREIEHASLIDTNGGRKVHLKGYFKGVEKESKWNNESEKEPPAKWMLKRKEGLQDSLPPSPPHSKTHTH